jgi:thiamine-phosphate pyrophosphorylase
MNSKIGRLSVITDMNIQKKYSHIDIAKMALKGAADILQFRDKFMNTSELIDTASRIKKICSKSKTKFIVNDRVDVAMIVDADGVHFGKEDIPVTEARKLLGKEKIIGATAHSLSEALKAQKDGADYIGFGHIYPTYSKTKTTKPKGLNLLRKVVNSINIPILAIGGIDLINAADVIETGVFGLAVIGAVVKSANPVQTIKTLKGIINA